MLTCPPLTAETFPYEKFEDAELAYLRLHGMPDQPYFYGDDWQTALSVELLEDAAPEMTGVVVFLEGCFGLETGFAEVFLDLGARAVVGSREATYSNPFWVGELTPWVGESSEFGRSFVKHVLAGETVDDSLVAAKAETPGERDDRIFVAVRDRERGVV